MLKPLEQWYCDVCGEIIEEPKKGYVLWQKDQDGKYSDIRIIHQGKCDNKFQSPYSMHLTAFLGEEGINRLLGSFLSVGPIIQSLTGGETIGPRMLDMDEYVDFFRRVQIPYYEEARRLFQDPDVLQDFNDANELYPYQVKVLKRIVENYSEK